MQNYCSLRLGTKFCVRNSFKVDDDLMQNCVLIITERGKTNKKTNKPISQGNDKTTLHRFKVTLK